MKTSSILFGIIGTVAASFAVTNIKEIKTEAITDETKEIKVAITKPKRDDLFGTYYVKSDKTARLTLNNDGTYHLTINVCDDYLYLTGNYDIRDTKLKLYNNNSDYDDLAGNSELTFEIVDEKVIKSEESLICTPQETLFEK